MVPAAFHSHELLSVQREHGMHHRSLGFRLACAIALYGKNARAFEEGGIKMHGLLGFAMLLADEQEEWNDFLCAAGEIQLPGNPKFVCDPSKLFTERIGIEAHKNRPAISKPVPQLVYCRLCLAVDKER